MKGNLDSKCSLARVQSLEHHAAGRSRRFRGHAKSGKTKANDLPALQIHSFPLALETSKHASQSKAHLSTWQTPIEMILRASLVDCHACCVVVDLANMCMLNVGPRFMNLSRPISGSPAKRDESNPKWQACPVTQRSFNPNFPNNMTFAVHALPLVALFHGLAHVAAGRMVARSHGWSQQTRH